VKKYLIRVWHWWPMTYITTHGIDSEKPNILPTEVVVEVHSKKEVIDFLIDKGLWTDTRKTYVPWESIVGVEFLEELDA